MRDPKADVYGYLVALVVQSGPDQADKAGLPPQYSKFA
jgi:hypothetical protein